VKIHLPSYPRGVHHIQESVEPANLDLDPEIFTATIQADVTLDRHDPYLEFDISLRTPVTSQCDRCLTEFQWELVSASPMLYVLGRMPGGGDVDDPGIGYLPGSATDVDLTADMRDLIILALPGKRLCREDCRGLCPTCGTDLNMQECIHHQIEINSNINER
jgi:uncharacterized protein